MTMQRLPRLTDKRVRGLREIIVMMRMLQETGWEGTPFDHNYEDPESDENLEAGLVWLSTFVNIQEDRRKAKP